MVKREEAMRRKSRATVPLDRRLEVRLASYALCAGAAGVGMLAAAQPADAQIIYTPDHAYVSCGTRARHNCYEWTGISFADNGPDQFKVVATFAVRTAETGTSQWAILAVEPAYGFGSLLVSSRGEPIPLEAGSPIGPNQKWSPRTQELAIETSHSGRYTCKSQSQLNWNNVKKRFLGLRFKMNGHAYYGWAELSTSVVNCRAGAGLQGYAYNSAPGQPILAGETQDDSSNGIEPPKQPTLGALALGSLGLALWRQESSPGSH